MWMLFALFALSPGLLAVLCCAGLAMWLVIGLIWIRSRRQRFDLSALPAGADGRPAPDPSQRVTLALWLLLAIDLLLMLASPQSAQMDQMMLIWVPLTIGLSIFALSRVSAVPLRGDRD